MNNDQTIHVHEGAVGTHEVHHHDGNGHGHHKQSFISKYIFSQDHKTIAKQFLVTGIAWAVIGALFSVIFRLQIGYPDQSFPFLETFLGKWAKGGKIDPDFYYAAVTMHGTIMIFFVLTAGLSGTFANLLIPLQVGARDMASPFLNMLSYWFFFIASIIMISSLFLSTGAASGGWTAYGLLVDQYGFVHRIAINGRLELCFYHSEYAY
jgi:cytochrome c oxidase subunit 1